MSVRKNLARIAFLAGIVGPSMNPARADSPPAPDGRFRLGIEYEHEKAADGRERADALTLIPGIKWRSGWLTMTELLIETEQEREAGRVTDRAGKLGIRLRKDFAVNERTRLVLRGLLGRALNGNESYTYAYLEPSLKYAFDDLEMMVGFRAVRAVDGTQGHDFNKFRIGPSFDLGQASEIEFRFVRNWEAATGRHASDAYIVEFVHKF
ncbi:hypothetical protein [Zoogloea sp.]|jgi:hypothetical protein|uniref:hypothetical protein n=1 Tax=Zoogloea sp. TaxID=49181 RepID=UPI001B63752F|nr:hypothetical protein [Zoogloea sp.]MBK6655619.1 hypothetical protein [Zoogloea sp.]MBP8134477.1 hypothetical protein [Zoogloea sp.]